MLDILGISAQAIVLVAFFAFLAERLVERLVKPWVPENYKEPVAVFATLALGVLAAVGFKLDIINQLLVVANLGDPLNEWVSIVTTGLIIGSGSQLIHDLWPGSTAKTKPYILGMQDAWGEIPDPDPPGVVTDPYAGTDAKRPQYPPDISDPLMGGK